jgi:uncharacterized protein YciW
MAASPQKLQKLKYTHEGMIDLILQDPTVTAPELAKLFGFSTFWVQRVIASDSFQARLAERRRGVIDPVVAATVNERLMSVTLHALTVLEEKLDTEASAEVALEALGIVGKTLAQLQGSRG